MILHRSQLALACVVLLCGVVSRRAMCGCPASSIGANQCIAKVAVSVPKRYPIQPMNGGEGLSAWLHLLCPGVCVASCMWQCAHCEDAFVQTCRVWALNTCALDSPTHKHRNICQGIGQHCAHWPAVHPLQQPLLLTLAAQEQWQKGSEWSCNPACVMLRRIIMVILVFGIPCSDSITEPQNSARSAEVLCSTHTS